MIRIILQIILPTIIFHPQEPCLTGVSSMLMVLSKEDHYLPMRIGLSWTEQAGCGTRLSECKLHCIEAITISRSYSHPFLQFMPLSRKLAAPGIVLSDGQFHVASAQPSRACSASSRCSSHLIRVGRLSSPPYRNSTRGAAAPYIWLLAGSHNLIIVNPWVMLFLSICQDTSGKLRFYVLAKSCEVQNGKRFGVSLAESRGCWLCSQNLEWMTWRHFLGRLDAAEDNLEPGRSNEKVPL